ncbi:rRNA maturation RNase YbeY [Pseudohaliea rubra]|uniref:Endoribonuclease YbeY n=1 Tax=Pseudohaliea rubra DSM 19751 TaxID=1265313 RepID=A0A095WZ45_9GAMM|nr:rRNA maturation RNase YbeY [Pseudohaliea rubra]KGE03909.1 metal-dependent hydrolase [Pseudohaliea rubra DSM 19751]
MTLDLVVQQACEASVPEKEDFERWIGAALAGAGRDGASELALRVVDDAEMAALNERFRGRSGPTNVLSFPADLPPGLDLPLLGDVVLCAPLVAREAREQGKAPAAHWAHLAVHGTLHLLGYDHQATEEAVAMEALETEILGSLGLPCPYGGEAAEEYLHCE